MTKKSKSKQTFRYSTINNLQRRSVTPHIDTWEEFKDNLNLEYEESTHNPTSKNGDKGNKSVVHFIGGSFDKTNLRQSKHMVNRTFVCLDIDSFDDNIIVLQNEIKKCFKKYAFVSYNTSSSKFKKPRARIILPLLEPIDCKTYPKVMHNFIENLSSQAIINALRADLSANTTANKTMALWYLNPKSKVEDRFFLENEGGFLKLEDFDSPNIPKSRLELDNDEVEKILSCRKASELEYIDWLKTGMALHHQYQGGLDGLDIWNAWSKEDSERYVSYNELENKYNGFQNKDDGYTMASLVSIYNSKSNNKILGTAPHSIYTHLKYNKSGTSTPLNTYENFKALCSYYGMNLANDIIRKKTIDINSDKSDLNDLTATLTSLYCLNNIPTTHLPSYIYKVNVDNKYNSFAAIMDNVTWDDTSRLNDFYNTLEVKPKYTRVRDINLLAWLKQAMYLSLEEHKDISCKNILTLKGDQSVGKSPWVRSLLPKHLRKEYIGDGLLLNTEKSMSVLACIKYLFVELAELEQSFKKSDINQFKAFFGRTEDTLNMKYISHPVTHSRTTSFVGTINDDNFLKDVTGSTRFLVIPIVKAHWNHNIDMLQLFKEIITTTDYSNFELSEEEKELQRITNKEFEQADLIEEQFIEEFEQEVAEDGKYFNCTQVLEQIGYNKRDINNTRRNSIARILRNFGFKYRKDNKKFFLKIKSK